MNFSFLDWVVCTVEHQVDVSEKELCDNISDPFLICRTKKSLSVRTSLEGSESEELSVGNFLIASSNEDFSEYLPVVQLVRVDDFSVWLMSDDILLALNDLLVELVNQLLGNLRVEDSENSGQYHRKIRVLHLNVLVSRGEVDTFSSGDVVNKVNLGLGELWTVLGTKLSGNFLNAGDVDFLAPVSLNGSDDGLGASLHSLGDGDVLQLAVLDDCLEAGDIYFLERLAIDYRCVNHLVSFQDVGWLLVDVCGGVARAVSDDVAGFIEVVFC